MDTTPSETIAQLEANQHTSLHKTPSPSHAPHPLPDTPIVCIRPNPGWVPLNLRDLWVYRELLYFLSWRDVKVRYKQTLLGVAWAVAQPLLTMLVFAVFFGRLVGVPSDGAPYPLFAFAGLVPWMFFSNAVIGSSNSLVNSAHLITKVYFPRLVLPFAAVIASLIDFAVACVILLLVATYFGQAVSWKILAFPVLVAIMTVLALGVGMCLSALNVKYRDVRHVLPFVVQLWMFATPIIYPASIVPPRWRWAVNLNPLAGIIEGFRAAVFGSAFDWPALGLSAAASLSLFFGGAFLFRKMEKGFADIV